MLNIEDIRKQYPQYNDVSDEQLLQGLHRKYYSDISFDDFTNRLSQRRQPAPVEQPPTTGLGHGAIAYGTDVLQGGLYSAAEGAGNLTGLEGLSRWGRAGRIRNEAEAERSLPEAERMSFAQAQSPMDYLRATGQAIGTSLPSAAPGLAGALAGTAIAGPVGGVIGGLVGSLPGFFGSHRQAQMEANKERGQPEAPVNEWVALGAAVPAAAAEGILDRFGLARILGVGSDVVGRTIVPRILRGAGLGAVGEVPTEVLQQVIERAQAGRDILSPEAMAEYKEAATAAFVAGAAMGGAGAGAFGRRPEAPPPPPPRGEDPALRAALEQLGVKPAAAPVEAAEPAVAPTPVPESTPAPAVTGEAPAPMLEAEERRLLPAPEAPVAEPAAEAIPPAPTTPPTAPVVETPAAVKSTPAVTEPTVSPAVTAEPVGQVTPPAVEQSEVPVVEAPTTASTQETVVPQTVSAPAPEVAETVVPNFTRDVWPVARDMGLIQEAADEVSGSPGTIWKDLTDDQKVRAFDLIKARVSEFAGLQDQEDQASARTQTEGTEALAPELTEEQKAGQEQVREQAREIVKKRVDALRAKGRQGVMIAEALDRATASKDYTPEQLYAAFRAGDIMANLLPAGANHQIEFVAGLGENKQGVRYAPNQGLSGIIQLSLAPDQLKFMQETAAHEAFHVLQDYYAKYDPKLTEVLNRDFRDGMSVNDIPESIQKKLKGHTMPRSKITYWDFLTSSLPDTIQDKYEAQAYVFGSLMDLDKRGIPITGVTPVYVRFTKFLGKFFKGMGAAVKSDGMDSLAVMERIGKGDAARFANEASPESQDISKVQYSERQTSTPEFKQWFGDSKAVDQDGKPKILYHGTSKDKDFDKFKTGPRGAWFTEDSKEASSYAEENDSGYRVVDYHPKTGFVKKDISARVIPVYLSIKNPATLTEAQASKITHAKNYAKAQAEVFEEVRKQGYDGVNLGHGIWVAFDPTQIKSAIGNVGSFNPKNQRIQYSERNARAAGSEFDSWWNGGWRGEGKQVGPSLAVNEDGTPKTYYHGTYRGFKAFGKAKSGSHGNEGPFFFSPDPRFAEDYAFSKLDAGSGGSPVKTGQRMIPVNLSIQKPFDSTEPGTQKELLNYINQMLDSGKLTYEDVWHFGPTYRGKIKKGEVSKAEATERARYLFEINLLNDHGNWPSVEVKAVQNYIRENGFDSFYLTEGGIKNLAVFDPRQVKSVFNKFERGAASNPQFSARQMGKVNGLPAYGSRVSPLTPDAVADEQFSVLYAAFPNAVKGGFVGRAIGKERVNSFFTKFQDKMLSVGQMIDEIKKNGGTVTKAMDAYLKQDLMTGRIAVGIEERESRLYRPLIEKIRDLGLTTEDVEKYLHARHAPERNERMARINKFLEGTPGSGMSDKVAGETIEAFRASGRLPKLEQAAKLFDAMIEDTRRTRVEAGLSPDFESMVDENGKPIKNYQYYAPLRRYEDESAFGDEGVEAAKKALERIHARSGNGYGARGKEDKSAMGSSKKVGNILAHAMLQNSEAVIRAEKNAVGVAFLNLIEGLNTQIQAGKVKNLQSEENPAGNVFGAVIHSAPIERKIVNGVVREVPNNLYKNDPDVMVVKRDGKEIAIRIDDPRIARSMKGETGLKSDDALGVIKMLGLMNQYLTRVNTSLNPEFVITNFFRDLQTAAINMSQHDVDGLRKRVIGDVRKSIVGVRKAIRNTGTPDEFSKSYEEFRRLGGTTEMYGLVDIEGKLKLIEDINQENLKATGWKQFAKGPMAVAKFLEDYNSIIENGIRVSAFHNLRKMGVSAEKAAQVAKNMTTNFNRAGENRATANALYLFYNASVQGSMAMANALVRSKRVRKIASGVVVAGLMAEFMNAMLAEEDETGKNIYDSIPSYTLEHNFIFMDPFGITPRGYFQIPMPYGFNSFWNLGRVMGHLGRGQYTPTEAASSAVFSLIEGFNPIGGTNSFLNFLAPTFADPIVDIATNRNFAGQPIVPERGGFGPQPPASQLYWSNTAAPYVAISQFLSELTGGTPVIPGAVEISPNMLKYLTNYAGGALASFAERVGTFTLGTLPKALSGDLEELEIREIPFVRKFFGNVTQRNSMEDYIKATQDVQRAHQEVRDASRFGESERVEAAYQQYPGQLMIATQVERLMRERSKINRQIHTIERMEMPDDEKKQLVKDLREASNQIVGMVNTMYNENVRNVR